MKQSEFPPLALLTFVILCPSAGDWFLLASSSLESSRPPPIMIMLGLGFATMCFDGYGNTDRNEDEAQLSRTQTRGA
eukprot:scaffold9817_cov154-Skeletonema_menzelii.AAC.8